MWTPWTYEREALGGGGGSLMKGLPLTLWSSKGLPLKEAKDELESIAEQCRSVD
jgi:hypothetical protein